MPPAGSPGPSGRGISRGGRRPRSGLLPLVVGGQVLQPVRPARYLDHGAVVADPVGDGARGDVVAEHLGPAAYAHVGRDDGGALLVARAHELEQQVGAALAAEILDCLS